MSDCDEENSTRPAANKSLGSERQNPSSHVDHEERSYNDDRGHRNDDRRPERGDRRRDDRRGGGGGGGGDRNFAFTEEMNVPSDCIGKIIGRAGSNIQRVQSDYNVRVDLDKERNVAKISGHSEGNVKDAMGYIQEQIDSGGDTRGGGGGYGGGGGGNRDRGDSRRSNNDWRSGGGGGGDSYRRQD